jgi:hypothetical protein
MDFKDVAKPVGALAALATFAAGALTVGYIAMRRDPETVRRVVRVAAGAMERVSGAWAETYEELADLWAEAREQARQEIEDAQFADKGQRDGDEGEEERVDKDDAAPVPDDVDTDTVAPSKGARMKRRA